MELLLIFIQTLVGFATFMVTLKMYEATKNH